jgi:hypothetical protein
MVEIAMQCSRRRCQLAQRQLDLCPASQPPSLKQYPRWSALPDQTRQTLSALLTGLLVAHASGVPQDEPPEVDSDER